MKNVSLYLQRWVQAGLITPEQQVAITEFEAKQPQRASWWLYSFMILGAVIIGLGIISLIAANWSEIPDSVKLGSDFALLTLLAGGIYSQYPQRLHGVGFEVLTISFLLLCLASIGLIAQIFHTGGAWYHALLFWASITLPLSLFARHVFTRFFWVTLFLHGALWSMVKLHFNSVDFYSDAEILPTFFLLAPLFVGVLYGLSNHVHKLLGFAGSLFFWFQISAVASLVFIDGSRSMGETSGLGNAWHMTLTYIITGLLVVGVATHPTYRWLNKILLLSALGLLLLYYQPGGLFSGEHYTTLGADVGVSWWLGDDIRAALLTLTILFLYAIHAGNIGHQRTFNLVTFLIGLRFVVLYFQAVGGLAATGVGLILSGLLIIGVAWAWHSWRERLRNWSKGAQA